MAWVRGFVVLLAVIQGGYMIFNGGHALVTGDYITSAKGPNAGKLGSWAGIVEHAGIPPRSFLMKLIFLAYGSLYLFAAYSFARGRRWGRAALLATALGSLWHVGIGTLLAFTQIIILLILPGRHGEPVNP